MPLRDQLLRIGPNFGSVRLSWPICHREPNYQHRTWAMTRWRSSSGTQGRHRACKRLRLCSRNWGCFNFRCKAGAKVSNGKFTVFVKNYPNRKSILPVWLNKANCWEKTILLSSLAQTKTILHQFLYHVHRWIFAESYSPQTKSECLSYKRWKAKFNGSLLAVLHRNKIKKRHSILTNLTVSKPANPVNFRSL